MPAVATVCSGRKRLSVHDGSNAKTRPLQHNAHSQNGIDATAAPATSTTPVVGDDVGDTDALFYVKYYSDIIGSLMRNVNVHACIWCEWLFEQTEFVGTQTYNQSQFNN